MIDINKLMEDVGKADAQRATVELDRMISLHDEKAEMHKKTIKKYLLHHARGEAYNYGGSDEGRAIKYAQHSIAAAMLRELKEELEETGKKMRK